MPLFAVSLLSVSKIDGALQSVPLRELAIHVVFAIDEAEARATGVKLGAQRQHKYPNADGAEVSWAFERVVECQELVSDKLSDGMEVSSWLFQGERLCLNDDWS